MTTIAGPNCATSNDQLAEQVASAAQCAWAAHGVPLEIHRTQINERATVTSLAAAHARRVEFVVNEDDAEAWEILSEIEVADSWQLCALVPLALLGKAHDRLRDRGFELQGWWIAGDKISFGNVEIA